jgi:hypothetical protein
VTFDVSWSFSWRAKCTEPAEKSVTGKTLEIENWDTAWVSVKSLPEKDSKESIERNHWQQATLSTNAAHHVMPARATNTDGVGTEKPSHEIEVVIPLSAGCWLPRGAGTGGPGGPCETSRGAGL